MRSSLDVRLSSPSGAPRNSLPMSEITERSDHAPRSVARKLCGILSDRRTVTEHEGANQSYLEDGVRLLDLSRRAHELFAKQPAGEKRKMLDLLLSNSSWKDGELTVTYREPFDIIAQSATRQRALAPTGTSEEARSEVWLPVRYLGDNARRPSHQRTS